MVDQGLEKLAALIKKWDYDHLSKSYVTIRKKISETEDENEIKKGEERVNLIRNEWESRKTNEVLEWYPLQSKGLFALMGYKVGIDGLKPETRRSILEDIIEGPIPLVGNPIYMTEWGEDNSEKRIRKVINNLYAFSNNAAHATHHQAIQDWKEDLQWVSKNYQ